MTTGSTVENQAADGRSVERAAKPASVSGTAASSVAWAAGPAVNLCCVEEAPR